MRKDYEDEFEDDLEEDLEDEFDDIVTEKADNKQKKMKGMSSGNLDDFDNSSSSGKLESDDEIKEKVQDTTENKKIDDDENSGYSEYEDYKDGDDEAFYEDDEDDDEGSSGSEKKAKIIIASAVVAAIAIAGAGFFVYQNQIKKQEQQQQEEVETNAQNAQDQTKQDDVNEAVDVDDSESEDSDVVDTSDSSNVTDSEDDEEEALGGTDDLDDDDTNNGFEESDASEEMDVLPTSTPKPIPTATPVPVEEYSEGSESGDGYYEEVENVADESENSSDLGVTEAAKVVFIGDARFREMANVASANDYGWECSSTGDYSWLTGTAYSDVERFVGNGTKVFISIGLNDLGRYAEYASAISSKATEWKEKGAEVYFVSIGPVATESEISNQAICDFNTYMYNNLGINFIDAYNKLVEVGFNTSTDYMTYTPETSATLYNYICSFI